MRGKSLCTRIWHTVRTTIFPERPDEHLITSCASLPVHITSKSVHGYTVISLCHFSEPTIRAAIHEAKFHYNQHAYHLLGTLLASWYHNQPHPYDILVPIPLSYKRWRERGYNQVTEILTAAHLPHQSRILTRHHRPPQTSLDRDMRLQNVAHTFRVVHPHVVAGKHILLIDDVYTTGATLTHAASALKSHAPASVTLLALAH